MFCTLILTPQEIDSSTHGLQFSQIKMLSTELLIGYYLPLTV